MKIGYARTSKADQNLDLQLDALKAYGVEKRFIFTDQASGKKSDRPGLTKALQLAGAGDELVVWRLDRLGRSMSHLVKTVTDLAEMGVDFRSLTENIETSTAAGKMQFHVFAALAEFERGLIIERIKAGKEAAKARGIKDGRRKAIPEATLDAAELWLNSGAGSYRQCARVFGVAPSTLQRSIEARRVRAMEGA